MIYLKEQIPYKQPGETSFKVSFDFNRSIVDTIKQVPNSIYHKKLQSWEIPATSLSRAITLLHNLDDIKVILLPDLQEEEKDVILNEDNYKSQPFDYQLQGIKYGLQHNKWLLLDSPGLGKTIQMIYLAQELKERGKINHCLVVCGVNSLKYNWKMEINKHSNLSVRILGERVNKKGKVKVGGIKDRLEDLKNPIEEFFTVTNIETLRDLDIVKNINNGVNKFDLIIFDECHRAKNPASAQAKGLLKLKAEYKVALTGTILTNSPLDAYSPLKWLGLDNSTFTNFKYYYCTFGGPFGTELIGYKNVDVLKDQLAKHSLRRTKDLLELPPKTIIKEYVEMDSKQATFYSNIVDGIVEQADKVHLNPANILSLTTRLRQATVCPTVLSSEDIPSAKIDRAIDLVEEIIANGSKVLIFSVFKEPLNKLMERLVDYNPVLCTGDVNDNDIEINKEKFQTDDSCKVMCATTQKLGTGVTLTAASYAIFLDVPWTAADLEQCEDRIHRIGSSKPVFIYHLITKDTIDERVNEIVEVKEAISDFIVDNKITKTSIESLKKYITDLGKN